MVDEQHALVGKQFDELQSKLEEYHSKVKQLQEDRELLDRERAHIKMRERKFDQGFWFCLAMMLLVFAVSSWAVAHTGTN